MSALGWGTGIGALAPEGLRGRRHLEKPTDSPVGSWKGSVAGESLGFLDIKAAGFRRAEREGKGQGAEREEKRAWLDPSISGSETVGGRQEPGRQHLLQGLPGPQCCGPLCKGQREDRMVSVGFGSTEARGGSSQTAGSQQEEMRAVGRPPSRLRGPHVQLRTWDFVSQAAVSTVRASTSGGGRRAQPSPWFSERPPSSGRDGRHRVHPPKLMPATRPASPEPRPTPHDVVGRGFREIHGRRHLAPATASLCPSAASLSTNRLY